MESFVEIALVFLPRVGELFKNQKLVKGFSGFRGSRRKVNSKLTKAHLGFVKSTIVFAVSPASEFLRGYLNSGFNGAPGLN